MSQEERSILRALLVSVTELQLLHILYETNDHTVCILWSKQLMASQKILDLYEIRRDVSQGNTRELRALLIHHTIYLLVLLY